MTDDVVDELAIEEAVAGNTHIGLTGKEMRIAWRRLESQTDEAAEIAETLGVSPRTVFRWRTGLTPAARPASPSRLIPTPASSSSKDGPATVASLETRIAEGLKSPVKTVQRAAERARDAAQRFVEVEREERGKAALCAEVAELERKLRDAKAKLRGKAAQVVPQPQPALENDRGNQAAIRAWCVAQGIEVPAKGRLPRDAVESYTRAHP